MPPPQGASPYDVKSREASRSKGEVTLCPSVMRNFKSRIKRRTCYTTDAQNDAMSRSRTSAGDGISPRHSPLSSEDSRTARSPVAEERARGRSRQEPGHEVGLVTLEGALGPVVRDLFVGTSPCYVQAVIRLPHVVHLAIRRDDADDLSRKGRRQELVFFRTLTPNVKAEDLDRSKIARELEDILAGEGVRLRVREVASAVYRSEKRLAVRADLVERVPHAAGLHTKAARSEATPARRIGGSQRAPRHTNAWTSDAPAKVEHSAERIGAVSERRPRVSSAIHRESGASRHPPFPRMRLRWSGEPVRVALGSLACASLVLLLGAVGGRSDVARDGRSLVARGGDALVQGVSGVVNADERAGAKSFAEARAAFADAAAQLQTSTTLVQRLVSRLDPADRFSTAEKLLEVGTRIASLGEEALVVAALFRAEGGTLTETLEAAAPKLGAIRSELQDITKNLARTSLAGLSPADVERFHSFRERLESLHRGLGAYLDSHAVLLELLGSSKDRQYLFLFQNNRELRPTGGFIGSFALVDVSRGEVRRVQVDTMYNPDGQLKDFLVPPIPLKKITDRWYARDANWFADFRQSARKVAHLFERSGGPTVDGVLAVTPRVLEGMLRLTGPIAMPDYGVTVTADTVVDETQRLVTFDYDRVANEPKAFIADLLPRVLTELLSLPRDRWGELVLVLTEELKRKSILVYFRDADAQQRVVQLGWGGALPSLPPPTSSVLTDHLGRVEANVGGHKTDTLIEQALDYDVTAGSDETLTATVVVTRHHQGSKSKTPGGAPLGMLGVNPPSSQSLPPDEDPKTKTNIVFERVFVPSGSALLEARGYVPSARVPSPLQRSQGDEGLVPDEDLAHLESQWEERESGIVVGSEAGFTTFGGWVVTEPEETTVTVLRYRLPFRLPRPSLLASILRYELLLTHQPGHSPVLTRATLRVPTGFRIAWTGPASALQGSGQQKATYAGFVERDAAWGAVIEER